MGSEAISVLIVDDHLIVREGLTQLLASADGIRLVGETDSGEEALLLCHRLSPDIVLMDVRVPGMGGIAASEAIARFHPNTRVIALSTFTDGETVAAMTASGARGYLSKAATLEELVDAIQTVHAGGLVFPERIAAVADSARQGQAPAERQPEISAQQRRVLALLAKGFTNPEIARYLGFSVATAGYHVSAILAKLEVSNRAEAAAMAIRERLVDEADL